MAHDRTHVPRSGVRGWLQRRTTHAKTRKTLRPRWFGLRLITARKSRNAAAAPPACSGRFSRAVDDFARTRSGVIAVVDDQRSVNEHERHAFGVLLRILISGRIGHRVGIEDDDIRPVAFLQQSAIFQSQRLRRK